MPSSTLAGWTRCAPCCRRSPTTGRSRRPRRDAAAIIVTVPTAVPCHRSKEEISMSYSLQDFARDTREILKAGSSRPQVGKVKTKMEQLLIDPGFVKQNFGDDQPQ